MNQRRKHTSLAQIMSVKSGVVLATLVALMGVVAASVSASMARPGKFEVAWSRRGTPTFLNFRNASGVGPKVPFKKRVLVSCRVTDTLVLSARNGGFYRIESAP